MLFPIQIIDISCDNIFFVFFICGEAFFNKQCLLNNISSLGVINCSVMATLFVCLGFYLLLETFEHLAGSEVTISRANVLDMFKIAAAALSVRDIQVKEKSLSDLITTNTHLLGIYCFSGPLQIKIIFTTRSRFQRKGLAEAMANVVYAPIANNMPDSGLIN